MGLDEAQDREVGEGVDFTREKCDNGYVSEVSNEGLEWRQNWNVPLLNLFNERSRCKELNGRAIDI